MATASQPTSSNVSAPAHASAPSTSAPASKSDEHVPDGHAEEAPPPDFKLAKVGSRDWVAGQPVDDAEFAKTEADAKKRFDAGQAASKKTADAAKANESTPQPHK